jgi:DASH complex subunit ASK1
MPAAPQLHAEVFSSPAKTVPRRTPGVSILTPAKPKGHPAIKGVWDSDDEFDGDDDNAFGSPPKTMQFHVPQSRLLKTPGKYPNFDLLHFLTSATAKQASKRIVEDLLMSAGVGGADEDEYTDEIDDRAMDPASPSVVRKAVGFEDESF